jgi:hypothetical protein
MNDWLQPLVGKTIAKIEAAEVDGEMLNVGIEFTDGSVLLVERGSHGELHGLVSIEED